MNDKEERATMDELRKRKEIPDEILLSEAEHLIAEGHTVTITVRGNSMNPFLVDRRDRVTLGGFTVEQLKPGVAVLARDPTGHIFFHRIIRRDGNTLTLQGDGNLAQTEESDTGRVMGIMTEAIRKDKRYAADGKTWLLYSYWWIKLKPIRRWLLALFRRI